MVHRPLLQRWTIFLDGDCFPGSWVRTTLEPEQRTPITVVHVKRFQERDKSKVCWDWRLLILQDRDDHQRLIWCFSFYFLGQCFLFFLENFSVWSFFRPQRPQVFLIKALQKLMVFVLESREERKYCIQDSKSVLKQQKGRLKAKAVSQRGFLHAVSAVQCEKNNMKQPRRKSVGKSCVTDNFFCRLFELSCSCFPLFWWRHFTLQLFLCKSLFNVGWRWSASLWQQLKEHEISLELKHTVLCKFNEWFYKDD